ncbi:MAG: hypothetical protein NC821_00365 [Candidatus Omnitrophica bacterium]|nr:hypothetical protein [Candidatus Omnitrophota bacterium]
MKRLFFITIINFLFLGINRLASDNNYRTNKEQVYLRRVRNNSLAELKNGLLLVEESDLSKGLEGQIKAARELAKRGSVEAVEILAEVLRTPFIQPNSLLSIISALSAGEISLAKAGEEIEKFVASLPAAYREYIESFVFFQHLLAQMKTGEIPPEEGGADLRRFLGATGPEGTTVFGGVEVLRGESSGVDLAWLKEIKEKLELKRYHSFESLTPVYYAAKDIRQAFINDPELLFWKKNESFVELLNNMETQRISPEEAEKELGKFLQDAQEFLGKLNELAHELERKAITSPQAVAQIKENLKEQRFSFWKENKRLSKIISALEDGKLDNQEAAEELRYFFAKHLNFPFPVSEAVLESLGEIATHASAPGASLAKVKLLEMLRQYYHYSLNSGADRILLYTADWNARLREIAFKALGKIDDPEVVEMINFALTGEKLTSRRGDSYPPEDCLETEPSVVRLLLNLLAEKSPSQAIESIKLIFSRHYEIELPALIYTRPPAGWRKGEEAFWFRGNKVELLYDNAFYDRERKGFVNLKLIAVESLYKIAKSHPELRGKVLEVLSYILNREKSAKIKSIEQGGTRMVINEKDVELYKDAPWQYRKVHILVLQDAPLMKRVEEIKKELEKP